MKQKTKKIILIVATLLIMFNIAIPTKSYAALSWEGIIFDPITFLITGIADAANNTMQRMMLPGSPKAIMNREDKGVVPIIIYSPAAIFANKVPSLDVNFIKPSIKNDQLNADNLGKLEEQGYTATQADKIRQSANEGLEGQGNSAAILGTTISKWYVALRDIALTGLLIVLVYIGIRILLSSTAEEQAKYKVMIKNWVMAIVLIAFMHFLMRIILYIVEIISEILGSASIYNSTEGDELFNTIRTHAGDWGTDPLTRMGYTIIYTVLTMYTIMFTIRYLKRVIYMAFLTVIAPMVALTYPIDKIKDGQSQAFNMWLKEYLFNLLIQPVHLLIYIILVSSAIDLAKTNMIYALVSVGFILQAEKFIKDMFGIQGEGGALDGNFITGAAFGGIISKLGSGASRIAGLTKGKEKEGKENRIRMHHSARTADSDASKNLEDFTGKKQKRLNDEKAKKEAGQKKGKISKAKTMAKNRIENSAIGKKVQGLKESTKKAITGIKNSKAGKRYRKVRDSRVGRTAGNLRRKYLNADTMKKAGKLAMMGYGAALGAAVGVAGGLASDDFQNVASLGAAGASGGALLGKGLSETAGNVSKGVSNAKEAYLEGKLGDKYDDHVNKKLDKKWENDPSVREHFQTTYGDNWREKMEEAKEYRKQGITDQSEIDKGIKIRDQHNATHSEDEQITNGQMANIMGLANIDQSELINNEDEIRKNQISGLVGGDKDKEDLVMELLKKRFDR